MYLGTDSAVEGRKTTRETREKKRDSSGINGNLAKRGLPTSSSSDRDLSFSSQSITSTAQESTSTLTGYTERELDSCTNPVDQGGHLGGLGGGDIEDSDSDFVLI